VPLSSEGAFGGIAVGVIVGLVVIGLAIVVMTRRPVKAPVRKRTSSGQVGTGTDELFPVSFGPYTLVRRLGKGGMAVVYQAERGDDVLALKRPLAGFLDDDRFRERFRREAELGRTLHHPNIIRIFEQGQVDDTPYFVMELVEGETLADCLDREGRLDLTPAARVAAQVAEALDYAHSKGVIHRDLKPSNIMIEPSGTVKVMDYGVARAQHLQEVTTTRAFVGTPNYAAPETAQGASQPASDMYSLGVILFEMLTGNLPFTGDTAFEVVNHHRTTPPPDPSSLNHALSVEIGALVLSLLKKEPSDRPTAEALRNELSDYLTEGR
jgi:serine/threonine protein kinase